MFEILISYVREEETQPGIYWDVLAINGQETSFRHDESVAIGILYTGSDKGAVFHAIKMRPDSANPFPAAFTLRSAVIEVMRNDPDRAIKAIFDLKTPTKWHITGIN